MRAYRPKATIQASIGAIPLSLGMLILTVAVLSIMLTARFGAWFIDASYRKFLVYDL